MRAPSCLARPTNNSSSPSLPPLKAFGGTSPLLASTQHAEPPVGGTQPPAGEPKCNTTFIKFVILK